MLREVGFGIAGSALGGGVTKAVTALCRKLQKRAFKQLFGGDVYKAYYIVYPAYVPPPNALNKPDPRVQRRVFHAGAQPAVAASSEVRAIAYLSTMIGTVAGPIPDIVSDLDVDERMDVSFVSCGGLTNFKTVDCHDDASNNLVELTVNPMQIKRKSGEVVAPVSGDGGQYDYGVILKIHPFANPRRTWVCCAGLGDWGTSGAAWFLAKRWREIQKRVKSEQFACVTQTQRGSDESTTELELIRE